MATTEWNYSEGVASDTITIPVMEWPTHFAKRETKTNEIVLANLTSPLTATETIRFAVQNVGNIYTGTGIDPNYYAPSRRGVSILAQVNSCLIIKPDSAASALQDAQMLPFSAHIVFRVPQSEYVTSTVLQSVAYRLIASLGDNKAGDASLNIGNRLAMMARGALTPTWLV